MTQGNFENMQCQAFRQVYIGFRHHSGDRRQNGGRDQENAGGPDCTLPKDVNTGEAQPASNVGAL